MTESGAGSWHVAGHRHAVDALSHSIETPAHAYLILGPDRTGKRTLATEFSKALNCEAYSVGQRPCQVCASCRLISVGGHPDVSRLEPPPDKERIGVEQIRDLRSTLCLRPSQGRWRVVLVRAPLTDGASDALLKTLEEPSSQVVLILTARDIQGISETIASRCRTLILGLVPTDMIIAGLKDAGVSPEQAERFAALSYGAIGWAKAAALNPDMATQREQIRDNLTAWSSMSLAERLFAAETLSSASSRGDRKRDLIIEELEIMLTWWRDILLAASGEPDLIVNSSSRAEIEKFAADITVARAQNVVRAIAEAGARIDQNVDPRLTLETLAIAL